jgi:hypothetical protein
MRGPGKSIHRCLAAERPDHYIRIQRVATPTDARTGPFVPDLGELFETIRHHGAQGALIDVYETK